MAHYILKADNPSKLSSTKHIYYVDGGGWSTDEGAAHIFEEKEVAETVAVEIIIDCVVVDLDATEESGFNPDAKDGDGDGIVQDGTKFERPIGETTPPVKKTTTRKPRSKKAGA